jgi:hypothetical protein
VGGRGFLVCAHFLFFLDDYAKGGGGQANVVFELAPMNEHLPSHIYGTDFELPQ